MTTTELQWVTTQQLCQRLCIGRSHLFKLKSEGIFQPGVHFRQNGSGTAPLAWDLTAVDQLLRQQAERQG
jgi:hypothetical protein